MLHSNVLYRLFKKQIITHSRIHLKLNLLWTNYDTAYTQCERQLEEDVMMMKKWIKWFFLLHRFNSFLLWTVNDTSYKMDKNYFCIIKKCMQFSCTHEREFMKSIRSREEKKTCDWPNIISEPEFVLRTTFLSFSSPLQWHWNNLTLCSSSCWFLSVLVIYNIIIWTFMSYKLFLVYCCSRL